MGRAPCCDKANVKRGPWSPEEDDKLKSYIDQNGTGGNWIALPQKIGLKRCGKSCRLRWLNYLRPNIKHGGFSEEEDNIICGLFLNIGSRWSVIASQLPGRTDNDIKNYWNTRLKKKLLGKQRKELQEARLNQEITKREPEYHHQLTENRTDIFFSTQPTAKTNYEAGFIMNNNKQQQTLYFPQMPQEVPNFFSYRKLTLDDIQEPGIKIENGTSSQISNLDHKFADYNNQIDSDFIFSSEDFRFAGFGTSINNETSVMASSTNSPLPDSRNNYNMVQGYNGDFQVESTVELDFNNLIPNIGLGTDDFFGTSNSADQSTISWDDQISSLVYQPSQKL